MSEAGSTVRMIDGRLADVLRSHAGRLIHVVTIATKPDIIKQAPIVRELESRGEPVLVCHTGQHRDHNYSGGMLEEFGIRVDVPLGVSGTLPEITAQIVERFARLLAELRQLEMTPVPYIHGDTATSMAVGVASYVCGVACAHVEAGIRTLTPRKDFWEGFEAAFRAGKFDFASYAGAHRDPMVYEKGSREPFPEQFNTRVSDAGSGYHAAPVELARDNLVAEGFPPDTIEVVGNTVADATGHALAESARATIFESYPQLRGGGFIRMCIHRRENTGDERRFRVYFDAIEELLRTGRRVLLIRLFGTDAAIDAFGLRERLAALEATYGEDFICSPVWPHYRDVIAAMRECALVATDSGSMQEEMNILGIGCVTLRYGSDRAETLLAGGNVLAPPLNPAFVARVISDAADHPGLLRAPMLYGEKVSARIADGVLSRAAPTVGLFRSEERRLEKVSRSDVSWNSLPYQGWRTREESRLIERAGVASKENASGERHHGDQTE
ncbi:MAG: UDP-N-acetyl glucosamine 2-epimerase [Nocardioides sp.]